MSLNRSFLTIFSSITLFVLPLFLLLLFLPPAVTHAATTCTDTYTNTTPIQTGYGAVYNLFSTAKEMLVKTNSCTDTTASVTLGNGDASTYVYKQGYQWNGTQWQALSFTGSSALISNLWYPGSANGSIPLATGNTSKYYVGYTCQQINSASGPVWKCGCQDTTCAVSAWQLQRVSKVSTAVDPTATFSANPTSVTASGNSTLTWTSTNATGCTGTNFSTSNQTSGNITVTPTNTTTYTLMCTNGTNNVTKTVTVTVGSATGERGRVHVANGTVMSDQNTILRGATMSQTADKDTFWSHLHDDLKLNVVRVDVKTVQVGKTVEQQLPWLDHIVDSAAKHHMYVMIHYSVKPGGYQPLQAMKDFWSVVASRYKNRTHVFYEMINEPTQGGPYWGAANQFTPQVLADLKSVYDIMRAGAPDTHIVMFSATNLSPDCATYAAMVARGTNGVDWTKTSVGYHFYNGTANFGEANLQCMRAKYPLIMTETSYWVEYRPPEVQYSLRLQEKLGISWFSLDGKGGTTNYLGDAVIPDLHAHGYNWNADN